MVKLAGGARVSCAGRWVSRGGTSPAGTGEELESLSEIRGESTDHAQGVVLERRSPR
jgi:hypothetical protein